MVQTAELAQKIADTLLEKYKDPPDHLELAYRGNPALELGDGIGLDSEEYFIQTQELIFDGTLSGKISAN